MIKDKQKILLVEDEAILAMLEMQQLKDFGYNVTHVPNGELALDLIKKGSNPIDLILMDIDLGTGMDGTETAKAILNEMYIPILFLSSHTEKEIVKKTEDITSYGYVVKNSSFTVLDASIKMAFKLYDANNKVEHEKENLKTILDSIGDGVIATDLQGNIIQMNPIAENLTGWTIEEANNKPLKDCFPIVNAYTREIHPNPVELVLSTGNIIGLANHTVLISKNGFEYQIADSGSPIKNKKGKITGVVLTFRDVTKEYEYQKKISESEALFKSLFENSPIGKALFSSDGKWINVNKAATNILGYNKEELLNKNPQEFTHHDDLEITPKGMNKVFSGQTNNFEGEKRFIHKDGHIVWVWQNDFLLRKSNNEPHFLITQFIDISDRKKAEEKIAFQASILENLNDIVFAVNEKFEFIYWNHAAEKTFGWKSEEVLGKSTREILKSEVLGVSREKLLEDLHKNKNFFGEVIQYHKNGTKLNIEANTNVIESDSKIQYITVSRDITERKKLEEAILDKANLLAESQRIARIGNWEMKLNSENLTWSDETYRLFGVKFGNIPRNHKEFLDLVHIEDQPKLIDLIQLGLEGKEPRDLVFRVIHEDGSIHFLSGIGELIRDKDNQPLAMRGTVQEVTQRILAEANLAQIAERLHLATEAANIGIWDWDIQNDKVVWDEKMFELYGLKKDQISEDYKTWLNSIHPDDKERSDKLIEQCLIGEQEYDSEFRILLSDSSIRWIKTKGQIYRDEKGKPVRMVGLNYDITQRKQTEKDLNFSEGRLSGIIDSAMDSIISLDSNQKIVLFNEAAEKMFGYQSKDMLGQKLDKLIPEKFRSEHDKQIVKFATTGVSKRDMGNLGQVTGIRSNGEEFPIEASISQINLNGQILFTAILRDVSIRKQAEEDIQNLLREKELILGEVHHRIKNNMNIVFSLLTIQANAQEDPKTKQILQDAASRVKSMNVLYDKLYRSEDKIQVSLKIYFPSLVEEILNIFPESKLVKVETHVEEIVLFTKQVSSLGIILNELITNSMKYAFNGKNDRQIKISVFRKENLGILEYEDNGVGISESISFDKPSGFGLQLIKMLVEQINGTVRIERNNGNKFLINFAIK